MEKGDHFVAEVYKDAIVLNPYSGKLSAMFSRVSSP